jgi:hypothetical protein
MTNAQMFMKIIISENQSKEVLKRLRRLEELRESIEYQTEIHNPCDESYFADGDEYADFCIDEALCFFYNDENCGDEDDDEYYDDEEDYNDKDEDDQSDREEVTKLMYDEFYDYLVGLWEDCD